MATIATSDFQKVAMSVGKIVDVGDFPEARNPSYRLRIDFGPLGIKTSSGAVQRWYTKADLLGRSVVAVTNFPARQIGPFLFQGRCLLAVHEAGRFVLVWP